MTETPSCPACGSHDYGPGPNYDNFRWIGCYKCGHGFRKDKTMLDNTKDIDDDTDPTQSGERILDITSAVCKKLDLQTSIARDVVLQCFAQAKLMDKKNQDYGPGNISGYGTFGVVVRMNDKFSRLKTLFGDGKKRRKPKNESIRDSLMDIANYAIIAILVEDGKWPKT